MKHIKKTFLFIVPLFFVLFFLVPAQASAEYPCGAPDQIQVGTPQGTCPSGTQTCTAYSFYLYTDGNGQAWCDNSNCAAPCSSNNPTNTPIPTATPTPPRSTGGACSVTWEVPQSPAANSNITIRVRGVSDASTPTWQNVHMEVDGVGKQLRQPVESGPVFVYENINTGAAGSTHTLTFKVGSTTCSSGSSFTTAGGTCSLSANTYSGMTADCANCIATQNPQLTQGVKDLGARYGNNWSGCSTTQLIGKWCFDIDTASCNGYKNGTACGVSCGTMTPTPTPSPTPAGAATPTPTRAQSSTPTPTPVPSRTTHYRISDTSFDRDDSGSNAPTWQVYEDEDEEEPLNINFTFSNANPGDELTLYVQFKNERETTRVFRKNIKYIGPNPVITSASCTFDPAGDGTLVTFVGTNFGRHDEQSQGGVKVNGQQADIISWVEEELIASSSATPTPTPTCIPRPACLDARPHPCQIPDIGYCPAGSGGATLGAETKQSRVVAKVGNKLPGRVRIPLLLTTDDGRAALTSSGGAASCTVNTTTVQFAAKIGCRPSGNFALSDVMINIIENVPGAKPVLKQKVTIDKDGNLPSDFIPMLEKGKRYKLLVKAPRTPTRRIEFTPIEGSNLLDDVSMDVGDIAPSGNPDGKINSLDRSQLVREWSTSQDTAKAGDFNHDGRVNSLDWSCMRENINKQDEDKIQ